MTGEPHNSISEERRDEAPPFSVTRDVPYLSLGSIMASSDEAESETVGRYGRMRLKAGLLTSATVCKP